jgi:hypothetical protein
MFSREAKPSAVLPDGVAWRTVATPLGVDVATLCIEFQGTQQCLFHVEDL